MKTAIKAIWYLPGPFYQYNEDVKALAVKANVRIIDANVTTDRSGAADDADLPVVTLRENGEPAPRVADTVAGAGSTAQPDLIDLGNGKSLTTAELEAEAVKLSGLTAAKFAKLKKSEREGFTVMALETAKAAANAS